MSNVSIVNPLAGVAELVALDVETIDRRDEMVERAFAASRGVSTDADYHTGEDIFIAIDKLLKAVETSRTNLKRPIIDLGKALDAAAKEGMAPLVAARDALGLVLGAYKREQAALRAAEIRRQEEEAARLQLMENERAEKERQRAQADADAMALPDEPAPQVPIVEHLPVRIEPARAPAPLQSRAIKDKKEHVLVILDASLVPINVAGACVRPIDEALVKRLMKSGLVVPGCRLDEIDSFASRGSR